MIAAKRNQIVEISVALLFLGALALRAPAREITAPEIASFLGISSWETRVALPPNTYSVDICPIKDGKIGDGLFKGQIDWAKDPSGGLTILAGPDGQNYKISISSKTGGTLSVSTSAFQFEGTYSPSLPETVGEGVFILFVDLKDRRTDGAQDSPSTYKRGYVLKVTKKL